MKAEKKNIKRLPKSFFQQEKPTMSTKEALKDIIPFLTEKEIKKLNKQKNYKIVYQLTNFVSFYF